MSDVQRPSMAEIGQLQNEEETLRFRLAAAHFYNRAKLLHFGGASLTLVFALVAPLVLLFRPELGPPLGAAAGTWIFVSRVALEPIRRGLQLKGATAQEHFDCSALNLEWNDSLARRLPHEEISAASRSLKGVKTARDWYATGEGVPWPTSVLLCQRSNAVWARRQHRAYAIAVVGAARAWFVVGVLVAALSAASLTEYLVTIALPSLPAFLDASDLARGHASAARSRQLLEDQTDALLRSGDATAQDLREIQDQLFNLRQEAPLVPGWFYKLIRPGFEADMQHAARQAAMEDARRRAQAGDQA